MTVTRARIIALRLLQAAALFASLGPGISVRAHDDPAASKKAEQTCAGCHGPMGNQPVMPETPRLGGQQYEYLRQALTAYHNGTRQNPLMSAMAQPLTPSEIDDLAWYYSRQHGLTTKY
jgi:cytochrome c553